MPYCLYIIFQYYHQLDATKKLQILGIVCLAVATIHDVFIVYQVRNQLMLIHFMLIAYALLPIMIVTKKYEDTLKDVLQLNEQVTALNISLEQKSQRTYAGISNFKQYNDTYGQYGHQAGDELLVKVVETIQRVIPSDAL